MISTMKRSLMQVLFVMVVFLFMMRMAYKLGTKTLGQLGSKLIPLP